MQVSISNEQELWKGAMAMQAFTAIGMHQHSDIEMQYFPTTAFPIEGRQ
jgi:hypothetical protein